MKKAAIFSAVAALALSAATVRSWARLWVLPAAFLGILLGLILLYWLFLAVFSLHISLKKDYDRPSKVVYRLLNSGYRFLCGCARLRVEVRGLERVPKGRFLLVSNHRSRFDNMVQSLALYPAALAFISKPANFQIPIGRRYIARSCYLSIDRDHPRSALKTIRRAAGLIAADAISIGVYPEGHRGDGAQLQPFKPGCLKIATATGCPILVAAIAGTERIHKNFPWRASRVRLDFLEALTPEGRSTVDLSRQIQADIQAHLDGLARGERI